MAATAVGSDSGLAAAGTGAGGDAEYDRRAAKFLRLASRRSNEAKAHEAALTAARAAEPSEPSGGDRGDLLGSADERAALGENDSGVLFESSALRVVGGFGERCGRHVVATRDIPAGKLLMASRAFAWFCDALPHGLSPGSSAATSYCHERLLPLVVAELQRHPERGESLYSLQAGAPWDAEPPLVGEAATKVDEARLSRIIEINCFGATVDELEPAISSPQAMPMEGCGLWLRPAMLNHSCLANVEWREAGGVMLMVSTHGIAAGNEVCDSYLSAGTPLGETVEQFAKWPAGGFRCRCAHCALRSKNTDLADLESDAKAAHDALMQHLTDFDSTKALRAAVHASQKVMSAKRRRRALGWLDRLPHKKMKVALHYIRVVEGFSLIVAGKHMDAVLQFVKGDTDLRDALGTAASWKAYCLTQRFVLLLFAMSYGDVANEASPLLRPLRRLVVDFCAMPWGTRTVADILSIEHIAMLGALLPPVSAEVVKSVVVASHLASMTEENTPTRKRHPTKPNDRKLPRMSHGSRRRKRTHDSSKSKRRRRSSSRSSS